MRGICGRPLFTRFSVVRKDLTGMGYSVGELRGVRVDRRDALPVLGQEMEGGFGEQLKARPGHRGLSAGPRVASVSAWGKATHLSNADNQLALKTTSRFSPNNA